MDLAELVKKYTEISGRFGRTVHLSEFGFSKAKIAEIISAFDDDYQISRYMALSRARDEELASHPPDSRVYLVNGFEVSHISFSPEIEKVL